MKKTNIPHTASSITLAIALAALAGCASPSNYQKGQDTAARLSGAADKIALGKTKIDAALTALNDLTNAPQSDLPPKFNQFNAAVKDLESSQKNVTDQVSSARARGNDYFKAWDQQAAEIKNEDIKKRSAERRAAVEKQFAETKKSFAAAQIAYDPFMADLKDIQTALNNDLTTGGVESVKGAADKAKTDAEPLKSSLDALSSEFRDLGATMGAATGATNSAPQPATDGK